MQRQIIAIGGGGPTTRAYGPALHRYVLEASGHAHPRLAYLGTASGDCAERWPDMEAGLRQLGAEPAILSLFHPHTRDLRGFLLAQDVILVGGGNTRNLLVLWREWGIDQILADAWAQGIVLAGSSAGGLCWFENGVTDSFGPGYEPLAALGWLRGSFCPHWDGEAERQPRYRQLMESGVLPSGWAVDEMVALHFEGDTMARVVTARPDATAYRASLDEGRMVLDAAEPLRLDPGPLTAPGEPAAAT